MREFIRKIKVEEVIIYKRTKLNQFFLFYIVVETFIAILVQTTRIESGATSAVAILDIRPQFSFPYGLTFLHASFFCVAQSSLLSL